jgi:hypothetical protein
MGTLVWGLAVTALSWICAWGHLGVLGEYSFFPLWIGYILSINGISQLVFGTSLLYRMGYSFLWLFAASVPMWWFFEHLNSIVQNWHYVFAQPISDAHYFIQASINFSTIVPAMLSTIALFRQLFREARPKWKPVRLRTYYSGLLLFLGAISFLLLGTFPHEAFPLVWVAPILMLEPLAYALGLPCFLRFAQHAKWEVPVSIVAGSFFNGFWWEFWNFYSFPKWYYTIPYVDFWKVFEMPFLGYFGYPFLGVIVFDYAGLILFIALRKEFLMYFEAQRPLSARDPLD